MFDPKTDYITLERTVDPYEFLVVVMQMHRGEYVQMKVSPTRYDKTKAQAIAKSWSAALGLGIR